MNKKSKRGRQVGWDIGVTISQKVETTTQKLWRISYFSQASQFWKSRASVEKLSDPYLKNKKDLFLHDVAS